MTQSSLLTAHCQHPRTESASYSCTSSKAIDFSETSRILRRKPCLPGTILNRTMKRYFERTDEEPTCGPVADRTLLKQFADHGDETAFAELVSRYGGLVLGVCRRVLRDEHGAEDAFQATFLVLARRASKIRRRSSLAGWLYAVAHRTALRANAKRHRRREEALQDDVMAADDTLAQVASRHEQQLLDEEIGRLPPKYREPLVLRYLLGKSNKQVADELGLTVGVVEGRLKRGRDRLRLRLARRGIGLAALLAAVGSSAVLEAATVDSLIAATVQSAAAFRNGAEPTADCSTSAIELAEKELAMSMSTSTVTMSSVAAAVVIVGLTLAAAGNAGDQPAHAEPPKIEATASPGNPDASIVEDTAVPVQLAADRQPADDAPPSRYSAAAAQSDEELRRRHELRAKYDRVDFKQHTASEEKIIEALDSSTQLDFLDAPLRDVVDFLKDYHQIEIQIDRPSLDDVGLTPDEQITKSLRGLRLRSALQLVLRDLDLTYVIRDEVLLITTPEVADALVETRVYNLHRLPNFDCEALVEVIRKAIRPETWRTDASPDETPTTTAETSKPARLATIQALPGCLVITQTQHAHEEIADLLSQLELYETCTDELRKLSSSLPSSLPN